MKEIENKEPILKMKKFSLNDNKSGLSQRNLRQLCIASKIKVGECLCLLIGFSINVMSFHLLVPSMGPLISELRNISHTTIYVKWDRLSIPSDQINGILQGFGVVACAKENNTNSSWYTEVDINTDEFNVTRLKAGTHYRIGVYGKTKIGAGEPTWKLVLTDYQGKILSFL